MHRTAHRSRRATGRTPPRGSARRWRCRRAARRQEPVGEQQTPVPAMFFERQRRNCPGYACRDGERSVARIDRSRRRRAESISKSKVCDRLVKSAGTPTTCLFVAALVRFVATQRSVRESKLSRHCAGIVDLEHALTLDRGGDAKVTPHALARIHRPIPDLARERMRGRPRLQTCENSKLALGSAALPHRERPSVAVTPRCRPSAGDLPSRGGENMIVNRRVMP